MKKGPNPKLFLLLAVASLVIGGGLTFTAYNGLQSAQGNLKKLQSESKNARALQRMLAESQASLLDSTSKLQHLELGVQDYAYMPTLMKDLDKLGKTSGIDVIGVRPVPKAPTSKKDDSGDGEKPKKKTYDELDIEVKGRGKYRAVLNFLEALGKFPQIVASRMVELSPKMEPGQTSSTLDVTINLRAYVFAASQAGSNAKKTTTAMATGSSHEG